MDKPLHQLDWSLVAAFLGVAETGSLSGAARQSGLTQPTLGRQIRALEDQLGVTLFHRNPRGFSLTDAGAKLVPAASAMRDAAQRLALTAAGETEDLAGTVRITGSVAMSVYHLPAIIAGIRTAEPAIAIELVASDQSRNLLFREADIAVRMYRPTQPDLIARHLGDLTLAIYAARSYIARKGMPRGPEDLAAHDFVGYDSDTRILDGFAAAGFPVTREFFAVRCDDNVAYWNLVRAGCGIGFAQRHLGATDPDLVEIDLGLTLPTLPVWLTAHDTMRRTPRVRRVWDLLATGLRPLMS